MEEISRIIEALEEIAFLVIGALLFLLILPFIMIYQYKYLKWRKEVKLDS